MTTSEFVAGADTIEAEIMQATAAKRILLQPKLEKFLTSLERDGLHVPRRLKKLNSDLIDEAIEARFDNMPV